VAELVRGLISDRPWGLTFGQFGLREITGELTVHGGDGRDYRVAFEHGAIVGATSPQPADAVTRIAMTSGLISSSQVGTVAKQIAATPEIDEIALLAAAARLVPDQIATLRRRVIAQRAARTFSVEAGAFVVDETITLAVAPDAAVDVRAVVLQGARMNLSELRLVAELRALGSHFTLGESAMEHASWFGFEQQELPILEALRTGITLPEIEARHREIDPRDVQAVVYALVACRECQATTPVPAMMSSSEPVSISFRRSAEPAIPTPLTPSGTGSVAVPRTQSDGSGSGPSAEQEFRGATGTKNDRPSRKVYADDSTALPPPAAASPDAPKSNTAPWPQLREKSPSTPPITARTVSQHSTVTRSPATWQSGAPTPSPTVARTSSGSAVAAARTSSQQLIPPRTISSPVLTPRTISQSSGAPGQVYSEGSDRVTQSIDDAAGAHKRGIEALVGGQLPAAVEHLARASSLNPHEFDYTAVHAWAQFLAATTNERTKLADKTRKMLNHATQKSREPAQVLLYLGQLERVLGRDKQAVIHFRAALAASPEHKQAMIEIQQIEEKVLEKNGFGLFKKKT